MSALFVDLAVGTRPNIVKLAPVLAALERRGVRCRVVHTGQHSDAAMLDALCEDLGVRAPDVRLGVAAGRGLVDTVCGRYWALVDGAVGRPRGMVVFGDVDSTLACAKAAAGRGIAVAHVEAGLRSFDAAMPEERNRIAVDALAELLFVTEAAGMVNLAREGVAAERVHLVGNVMIDALARQLAARDDEGDDPRGVDEPYVYVTLHRPANVDPVDKLRGWVAALVALAGGTRVVFAVHPRTRKRLEAAQLTDVLEAPDGLTLLGPQRYRDNLRWVRNAAAVVTDSGGLQEETSWLGVPCITGRTSTERPVTVALGTNRLLPRAPAGLVPAVRAVLAAGRPAARPEIPGWDGGAAERIAELLVREWDL